MITTGIDASLPPTRAPWQGSFRALSESNGETEKEKKVFGSKGDRVQAGSVHELLVIHAYQPGRRRE